MCKDFYVTGKNKKQPKHLTIEDRLNHLTAIQKAILSNETKKSYCIKLLMWKNIHNIVFLKKVIKLLCI